MRSSQGGRLARVMAVIAGLGVVVIPLAESFGWALLAWTTRPAAGVGDPMFGMVQDTVNGWGVSITDPTQITTSALFVGWIISLIGATPMVIGLWSVRRTFLESAEGRPFSDASVRSFRLFAWASLAAVLAAVVERTATGLAVSVLSPDIQNQLSIGLGSEDFSRLFGALLLVAVAHMFAEGKRLAEDVEGLL